MHIVFWSPAWPLGKFNNGIVTYVHWMKRELEAQGHRVSVFTNYLEQSDEQPGVYRVSRSIWQRLSRRLSGRAANLDTEIFGVESLIAGAIRKLHRKQAVDIIEMEESFGWFAEVARETHIPLVVKLHGPAFLSVVGDELLSRFVQEQIVREGRALESAVAILSPSQRTMDQTFEKYRLLPRESCRIANPVTIDRDSPLWQLQACNPATVLFVGRFDLRKGADIVLKAFLLLLQNQPDLKLIFAGPDLGWTDPSGTRIHFKAYLDSVYPVEFRDRVEYKGRTPNHEIAVLRAQSMVTVIASRWENSGYTLLEAMLQGCPVVSTDAGGCAETVAHGVTGLLAKSEDPRDFAAQLQIILGDPARAAALGCAARQYVLEEHSATKIAAESLEFYKKVIAIAGG